MGDLLTQAQHLLLEPAGISHSQLGSMLSHSVDAADLYFQSTRHESWIFEGEIIKEGSRSRRV